jgi:5-bromo-4-chloroindolyl phosphate hydrolysis protein
MNSQTVTEYLIFFAVVAVIALIIVGVLYGVPPGNSITIKLNDGRIGHNCEYYCGRQASCQVICDEFNVRTNEYEILRGK